MFEMQPSKLSPPNFIGSINARALGESTDANADSSSTSRCTLKQSE